MKHDKPTVTSPDALWDAINRLVEDGELRRLSGAFARFVASLGLVAPPVLRAPAQGRLPALWACVDL